MGAGKVKATKMKVYSAPEGTTGLDGRFHVYTYDVFHQTFLAGKSCETVERAVSYQRHEQERIYAEQEAEPELFDLPFLSSDHQLLERLERNPEYQAQLTKDLTADARDRGRHR